MLEVASHYQLGSKEAHRAMQYNPRVLGLAMRKAGVWLRANETVISAALYGPCGSRRTLLFTAQNQRNSQFEPIRGPTVPLPTQIVCFSV